ncbi:MAG: PLP-dependent lyase/thiolase [Candidatus Micrarchaeota archaeon]
MRLLRIGHTPLREYHQVSGMCRGARAFIKDESVNEISGTHKDRRCEALLATVKPDEKAVLIHITCGNSGLSMGQLTKTLAESEGRDWKSFRVKVVNIVSKDLPKVIKDRLKECSFVHEMDLTNHELTQDEMRSIAKRLTDCTDEEVRMVESYQLDTGYRTIIQEIQRDLAARGIPSPPSHIVCPVGSAELAIELVVEASNLWGEDAPKIIGVSIPTNAHISGKRFSKKRDRSIADKIVTPCSPYSELVRDLQSANKLELITVKDRDILRMYRRLQEIGIHSEPSAAIAFAGAMQYSRGYGLGAKDTIVIVNTGEGVYDKKAVEKHWIQRLRSAFKYASIILATAAVVSLVVWAYMTERNKITDLNRKLLEARVLVYADADRNYWLDKEEATAICRRIPGKNCESPLAGPFIYGFQDFSVRELGFYAEIKEAESMNDMTGRRLANDIRYAFEHNRLNVIDGEVIWWYYDHEVRKWYRYVGEGEKVYEPEFNDFCEGRKNMPPTVCPP